MSLAATLTIQRRGLARESRAAYVGTLLGLSWRRATIEFLGLLCLGEGQRALKCVPSLRTALRGGMSVE